MLCHTTSFTTPQFSVIPLSNTTANAFTDLLVHHMGGCRADNIVQGDEFRTAPLWGIGQRVYFMHDGNTTNIIQAIEEHFCNAQSGYGPSEANAVVNSFNALSAKNQQDLVNFRRSL